MILQFLYNDQCKGKILQYILQEKPTIFEKHSIQFSSELGEPHIRYPTKFQKHLLMQLYQAQKVNWWDEKLQSIGNKIYEYRFQIYHLLCRGRTRFINQTTCWSFPHPSFTLIPVGSKLLLPSTGLHVVFFLIDETTCFVRIVLDNTTICQSTGQNAPGLILDVKDFIKHTPQDLPPLIRKLLQHNWSLEKICASFIKTQIIYLPSCITSNYLNLPQKVLVTHFKD
jgi:hypothetical protein